MKVGEQTTSDYACVEKTMRFITSFVCSFLEFDNLAHIHLYVLEIMANYLYIILSLNSSSIN